MNATKRFLTATAVTVGALGIGAGVLIACRQELSPGAQSGAAGAERRPSDAKYDDGDYDFYFKNGTHVKGDCDGYNSEPGGKTTIYEWSQSEINKWEKRLLAAGVKPEVYRTSKPKHCWVRFDTDLQNGIGWEGRGINGGGDDEVDMLLVDPLSPTSSLSDLKYTRLNFKDVYGLHYVWSEREFGICNDDDDLAKNVITKDVSKAQKNRGAPSVVIFFTENKDKSGKKALRTLGSVDWKVEE